MGFLQLLSSLCRVYKFCIDVTQACSRFECVLYRLHPGCCMNYIGVYQFMLAFIDVCMFYMFDVGCICFT